MKKEFKFIKAGNGGIFLKNYDNFEDDFLIGEGESVLDEAPELLTARFDKHPVNQPEYHAVYDFIRGLGGGLKISKRVKELLEKEPNIDVEFLPLQIFDSKNKPLDGEYFVMNPLQVHEFIDMDKSEVVMNSIDENAILTDHNTKLVFLESGEFEKWDLFTPNHLNYDLVMSSDLIKKMEDAGFTNLGVIELTYENWGDL